MVTERMMAELSFFLDRTEAGPSPLGGLLAGRLVRLADAVEAQQTAVRGNEGALSELEQRAPELVPAFNRIKRRHSDVVRQLRWLAETLQDRCAGQAPAPILENLRRTLSNLDAAAAAENRLVLDAWWQETGAVD